jgi:uncharacterized OsmC-like protein
MELRVRVRVLEGKQLLGTARARTVVTDRPLDEGGTDTGFTSGEMLLLAIGSCACGSVRNYLLEQGHARDHLAVDVFFERSTLPGTRDRIVISLDLDEALYRDDAERLRNAALCGGVTSRMKLGSEVEVRFADHRG